MRADDLRANLEETVRVLITKELARFDIHRECKSSARCEAVEWTELGENQWEQLAMPSELVENDDEVTRASEILAETYRIEWLARVKPCK